VDAASLKNYPQIQLHAGMPADLFVTTPERTLFQYLTKPLTAFASRAMREP
jgi:HlyD family secretion protein